MKLFTNKADIVNAIAEVSVTGLKLDKMIWVAAASVVAHIEQHNDVTLANDLVEAMPKGSRVNALIAYFDAVSKANYDVAEKTFKFKKSKSTKQEIAQTKSWVEYKPEQPYGGMDLRGTMIKMIVAADKALSSGNAEHKAKDKINAKDLADIKLLAATMGIELPKAPETFKGNPFADEDLPTPAVQADPLMEAPVTA